MSAEFFAFEEEIRSNTTGKPTTRTTYVNLDAILYVVDEGTPGEPVRVHCSDKRTFWLVNEEASWLIKRLKQRAIT